MLQRSSNRREARHAESGRTWPDCDGHIHGVDLPRFSGHAITWQVQRVIHVDTTESWKDSPALRIHQNSSASVQRSDDVPAA